MFFGEFIFLFKESIEFCEGIDRFDMNGVDRNNVLFFGIKVL